MVGFLRESALDWFNDGLVAVTRGDFVHGPVSAVALSRDDDLGLSILLTSEGFNRDRREHHPPGTVRRASETIEFGHPAGWTAIARGVTAGGMSSSANAAGVEVTVETYSAQSIELDRLATASPAYAVEWIANFPRDFIWQDVPVRIEGATNETVIVDPGDHEIRVAASSDSGGSMWALHLNVSGVDLYLMASPNSPGGRRDEGLILYRSCPDQVFRDKVRACLSFALGGLLVYLGHTEYGAEWSPTRMRSVGAMSVAGRAFKLPQLPPYPINAPQYANIVDAKLVERITCALFDKFEAIQFGELSWSYWHAMCAPLHTAPVSFGSLIEQLQNNAGRHIRAARGKLLDESTWDSLNRVIREWLKTATVDPSVLPVLKSKIASINQAPQNVVLKRLLDVMGLAVGDAEMNAWKHRNRAAHGYFADEPVEPLLNSKLLRLLFHRFLAGVTGCSDRYIDYYNIDFPVRRLSKQVPSR